MADIQSVPAIDLLRRATKAPTGSENFPQLGFVRFQLGLKRLARHGTKLVTRLNAGSGFCNENNFKKSKNCRYRIILGPPMSSLASYTVYLSMSYGDANAAVAFEGLENLGFAKMCECVGLPFFTSSFSPVPEDRLWGSGRARFSDRILRLSVERMPG